MKKVEILAPVGNMECFYAAIEAGCDAVYLGGYLFGARSYAGNFSNEELEKVIAEAHLYGVKVYVTVNTLIYEEEVEMFMNYIDELVRMNVDALIIQDIGMLDLIHQTYPELELHASTQMHIHNEKGVEIAEKLGCKRVVLARETDIDLIRKIRSKTSLELEIFVHGALCVSYSGQCLMSSLIGGRSGNRGTCAGTCRLPYTLVKKEHGQYKTILSDSYLLSMKDLNTLEHIQELLDAGVDSLKIEGRMKRPSYVYQVVSLYRKAVEQYEAGKTICITKEDQKELQKIFHRGSTKGFLFHEDSFHITNDYRPNHMGVEIGKVIKTDGLWTTIALTDCIRIHDGIRILGKKDIGTVLNVFKMGKEIVKEAKSGDVVTLKLPEQVEIGSTVVKTTDQRQLDRITRIIEEQKRKVSLTIHVSVKVGSPIELKASDGIHVIQKSGNFIVVPAQNKPVTKSEIEEKMLKLGNTVYCCNKMKVDLEDGCFFPMKEINELRRMMIEEMNLARTKKREYFKNHYHREVPNYQARKEKRIFVTTKEQYEELEKELFDEIYVSSNLYEQVEEKDRVVKRLPRVMTRFLEEPEKLLISELGSVLMYPGQVTDYSLNVTNSYSVALLHALGVKRVTLSYELNQNQIEQLLTAYQKRYHARPNLELIVFAKEEMMTSKFLLPKKYQVEGELYLKDRFGNYYFVNIEDGYMVLYHDKRRIWNDYEAYYQMGIHSLRWMLCPLDSYSDIKNKLFR